MEAEHRRASLGPLPRLRRSTLPLLGLVVLVVSSIEWDLPFTQHSGIQGHPVALPLNPDCTLSRSGPRAAAPPGASRVPGRAARRAGADGRQDIIVEGVPSEKYVLVSVKQSAGKPFTVEIRPGTDTVRVCKKMIELVKHVPEKAQKLLLDGVELDNDDAKLSQYGVTEGSHLIMETSAPEEDDDDEELKPGDIPIIIRIDLTAGRTKRIQMALGETETIGEMKERAWVKIKVIVEELKRSKSADFGLFILESSQYSARGLRALKKSEQVSEKKTASELGFQGGEEMVIANNDWVWG